MKHYERLLDNNVLLREVLDIYLELRLHFKEMNFTEADLDNPPVYTPKMMNLHERFTNRFNKLLLLIRDFGFEIEKEELVRYIKPLLMKINELTPLENGDNKRNNTGNKDN